MTSTPFWLKFIIFNFFVSLLFFGGFSVSQVTAESVPPQILNIYPAAGSAGTKITLAGNGFTPTNNTVRVATQQIQNLPATPYVANGITYYLIQFNLPSITGCTTISWLLQFFNLSSASCDSVEIQVINENGSSNEVKLAIQDNYSPTVSPSPISTQTIEPTPVPTSTPIPRITPEPTATPTINPELTPTPTPKISEPPVTIPPQIPQIISVYPSSATAGTKITLAGNGFTPTNNTVRVATQQIQNLPATPYVANGITYYLIQFNLPSITGCTTISWLLQFFNLSSASCDSVEIQVINENGSSNEVKLAIGTTGSKTSPAPIATPTVTGTSTTTCPANKVINMKDGKITCIEPIEQTIQGKTIDEIRQDLASTFDPAVFRAKAILYGLYVNHEKTNPADIGDIYTAIDPKTNQVIAELSIGGSVSRREHDESLNNIFDGVFDKTLRWLVFQTHSALAKIIGPNNAVTCKDGKATVLMKNGQGKIINRGKTNLSVGFVGNTPKNNKAFSDAINSFNARAKFLGANRYVPTFNYSPNVPGSNADVTAQVFPASAFSRDPDTIAQVVTLPNDAKAILVNSGNMFDYDDKQWIDIFEHELCHVLGCAHEDDPDSLMNWFRGTSDHRDLNLSKEEIDALNDLYNPSVNKELWDCKDKDGVPTDVPLDGPIEGLPVETPVPNGNQQSTKVYGCNQNGMCEEDPNGEYDTSNCYNSCANDTPKYFMGCGSNCSEANCQPGTPGCYDNDYCDNVSCTASKFTCNSNHQCVQNPDGDYDDSTSCERDCSDSGSALYTCRSGCGVDPNCQPGDPYCRGSVSSCRSACQSGSSAFSCDGSSCVSSTCDPGYDQGCFSNPQCDGQCGAIGKTYGGYTCASGCEFDPNCEPGTDPACNYSQGSCQNACGLTSPTPIPTQDIDRYSCVSSSCQLDPNGESYESCAANCGSDRYTCISQSCAWDPRGEYGDYISCSSDCETLGGGNGSWCEIYCGGGAPDSFCEMFCTFE